MEKYFELRRLADHVYSSPKIEVVLVVLQNVKNGRTTLIFTIQVFLQKFQFSI